MITLEFYRSNTRDRKQRYRWRVTARNGRVLADSGEGYARRADCTKAAALVLGVEPAEAITGLMSQTTVKRKDRPDGEVRVVLSDGWHE